MGAQPFKDIDQTLAGAHTLDAHVAETLAQKVLQRGLGAVFSHQIDIGLFGLGVVAAHHNAAPPESLVASSLPARDERSDAFGDRGPTTGV